MDIEEVAHKDAREDHDVLDRSGDRRDAASRPPRRGRPSGSPANLAKQVDGVVAKLYAAFVARTMALLEINRWSSQSRQLICLDAKVGFDGNAPTPSTSRPARSDRRGSKEIEASKYDLNYVASTAASLLVTAPALRWRRWKHHQAVRRSARELLDVGGSATKDKSRPRSRSSRPTPT